MFNAQLAAQELLNRRQPGNKSPRLAPDLRPESIEQALAVQTAMAEMRTDAIVAWKCLLPPDENSIVVAPIFADTVNRGELCTFMADNGKARVEPEIAFVLGKDLVAGQQYSDAEIADAVASTHMALELMQTRFADDAQPSFFEKLADGLSNNGLYIGAEINKEKAFSAAQITINIKQGEQTKTYDGIHPNLGAAKPLTWLFNYMTARGVTFKAGQAFITGSFCGIVDYAFDQAAVIEYQGIGAYQVTFKEIK